MRFSILAVVLGVFMPAVPVLGQASAPEECAVIAADSERLACYDAIFGHTGDIDGAEPVVLSSEQLIPAKPTGRAPATMMVACVGGQARVTFGFAGQQVSTTGDIAPVTFQVDQGGNSVKTLSANEGNVELAFSSARDNDTFLDSLTAGRNLRVRMTPVRQRSLTVDFRLADVADDIEALRAGCR